MKKKKTFRKKNTEENFQDVGLGKEFLRLDTF